MDRSGSGPVAEVYPAASLRNWSLDHHGYKQQTKTDALGRLVDHLLDEAPWLDCTTYEQALCRSHDIFDAVIAAMTARAAARICRQVTGRGNEPLAVAAAGLVLAAPRVVGVSRPGLR